MAVYYKFKSAKDYDSIAMDGPFISVGTLKEKIFENKHLGRGTDFDLVVTNAQTNEEYIDEGMLIPKNTSVLIRRVPGRPRMPIVTDPNPMVEDKMEELEPEKTSFSVADSSAMKYHDDSEWDDLGGDLYEIPEVVPVQSSHVLPEATPTNKADEESKLQALIDTPALDWQRQGPEGFGGAGRGFGRGMGGRMMGGRGFGMERKTPPQGYICHRCKVPGHFIQHCPTNGDPNFDIKRVKPPTGIPKSMLMATPDGSYALPSGAVAVLRPNEAAFEKEIEGFPSTRSVGDLPPELHCPLCKEVMKDAVLTSKCCFKSFCDKCVRDYIISKSMCVCGATNILADDLLPNKTLRDTINRILESGNSSADNAGSTFQVQDMESARCPLPKNPSPSMSAASKGEHRPSPVKEETLKVEYIADEAKPIIATQQTVEKVKTARIADVSEPTHESVSVKEPASQCSAPLVEEEVQQKLISVEAGKKKKKKKVRMPANDLQWKASQDFPVDNYMMPMGPSAYNPSYNLSYNPSAYNPYWGGMQPSMDGYMTPFGGQMPGQMPGQMHGQMHGQIPGQMPGQMPYMGYNIGPLDMPFGPGFVQQDPFGGQGCMYPVAPPQRDLSDFGMGRNLAPPHPLMSREEFEARKADLRRKRENERRGDSSRDFSKDLDFGREVNSRGGAGPMKPKSVQRPVDRSPPPPPPPDYTHRHRSERSSIDRPPRDIEPPRPPKRKSDQHHDRERDRDRDHDRDRDYDYHDRESDHHHHYQQRRRSGSSGRPTSEASTKPSASASASAAASASSAAALEAAAAALDRKNKASVFSRISFPEGEVSKKRKLSSSPAKDTGGSGGGASVSSTHHKTASSNGYYEDHHHKSSSSSVKAAAAAVSGGGRKSAGSMDYESSDEDRHFKRKPSRYEPSPPPASVDLEEPKHSSRGSRDRERSKHR
ncbi:E3 ubiquitin ligase PARAQUAT TOLERANCE 3 isoform X1 [Cannabis sativa]|uniref:E3 ubiquitin ligase PARAQUAT TOLERANCE 3 isoform X1 n=1 Tax=Cannabis sativa TaxID=3483 RepID=UPI0029CA5516|nr:E3 ubiquitin ligase PARAQUAT TOLERANCE 3 isoform X1 [Cannabis sativa]